MVILDTNIIIDHLRSKGTKDSVLMRMLCKYPKETLGISMISIQELFEGKSTEDEEKLKDMLSIIAPLRIIPYSYEIAKTAGCIARDLHRPIELADAAIASTAIVQNAKLATLNGKDFKSIPELELLNL